MFRIALKLCKIVISVQNIDISAKKWYQCMIPVSINSNQSRSFKPVQKVISVCVAPVSNNSNQSRSFFLVPLWHPAYQITSMWAIILYRKTPIESSLFNLVVTVWHHHADKLCHVMLCCHLQCNRMIILSGFLSEFPKMK